MCVQAKVERADIYTTERERDHMDLWREREGGGGGKDGREGGGG